MLEYRENQLKETRIILKWLHTQYIHQYKNILACMKCCKKIVGEEWLENIKYPAKRYFCECEWARKMALLLGEEEYFEKEIESLNKLSGLRIVHD